MAWALVGLLAVVMLVSSEIVLRYGVHIGQTRVHWHSTGQWRVFDTYEVTDETSRIWSPIGKAYQLAWVTVCVYRKANSGLEPDRHRLWWSAH
jgi:hypothetical protein